MKAEINNKTIEPSYIPKVITITMESLEDEVGLRHLIGCWDSPEKCNEAKLVKKVAERLQGIKETLALHLTA